VNCCTEAASTSSSSFETEVVFQQDRAHELYGEYRWAAVSADSISAVERGLKNISKTKEINGS
jgi:hypothetical protein